MRISQRPLDLPSEHLEMRHYNIFPTILRYYCTFPAIMVSSLNSFRVINHSRCNSQCSSHHYQTKVWYRVQQSRKLMLELLKCTSTAKDIAYTVKYYTSMLSVHEYVCMCLLYVTDKKKKCALYFQHTNRFIIIYFEIKTHVDTLVQFAHTLTSVHECTYIFIIRYILDKNTLYTSSVLINYFEIKIHTDTLVQFVDTLTSLHEYISV